MNLSRSLVMLHLTKKARPSSELTSLSKDLNTWSNPSKSFFVCSSVQGLFENSQKIWVVSDLSVDLFSSHSAITFFNSFDPASLKDSPAGHWNSETFVISRATFTVTVLRGSLISICSISLKNACLESYVSSVIQRFFLSRIPLFFLF